MLFGWEINYVVGLYKAACIVDEHSSRLHSAVLAGNDILLVIFRPFISELQRNAFPHDSNAVDSIDDRVNVVALRDMTDDSGGRTEIVRDPRDLNPATANIADELSKQYYLGYPSTGKKDGRWHSIRVELRNSNYRVRARRGYVAS